MNRRGGEAVTTTFANYGAALDQTPDLDLPDPKSVPVEVPLLVDEAKIACTTGMLLCLDRRQRLIFTLGEIFGASDTVGVGSTCPPLIAPWFSSDRDRGCSYSPGRTGRP